jgi:hypothetical protein
MTLNNFISLGKIIENGNESEYESAFHASYSMIFFYEFLNHPSFSNIIIIHHQIHFDFEIFSFNKNMDSTIRSYFVERFHQTIKTAPSMDFLNKIWKLFKQSKVSKYVLKDRTKHQINVCTDPNLFNFPSLLLQQHHHMPLLVCTSCFAPVDIKWTSNFTASKYEWDNHCFFIYWIPEEVLF